MSDNPPKVIIKEIPTPIYPVSYQGIDIKYENILKKRSLKNIKGLNPIYNPGIFQFVNVHRICFTAIVDTSVHTNICL